MTTFTGGAIAPHHLSHLHRARSERHWVPACAGTTFVGSSFPRTRESSVSPVEANHG
ncbi:MAG TPA: hypothetical protein VF814_20120 [Casimicrobiaceae bacterium]